MELRRFRAQLQPFLQPLADIFRAQAVLYDPAGLPLAASGEGGAPIPRPDPGGPVRQVRERAVALAADQAGGSSVCRACPEAAGCKLTAELLVPVTVRGDVVATLGLMGHTPEARLRLLESRAAALQLMHQVAESVVLTVQRRQVPDRTEELRRHLLLALQGMARPAIAVDADLQALAWNEAAAGLVEPLGRPVESDSVLPVPEELARQIREGRRARRAVWGPLLVESQPVRVGDRPGGALILLREAEEERATARSGGQRRQFTFADLRGASPAFVAVKEKARRAARTESTVLLLGESGTGKEIFARAIHAESSRQHGPFVAVNCAAIPDNLLESELFGYEEGAFTGARRGGKPGKIQSAAGGTLFLDEVGDLPLHLQAKLLRVLQFKEVEPVGAAEAVPVDFRLIGATNRQLENLIAQGRFREDLFYRLHVFPLVIPPLRERKDDLYILLTYMSKKWSFQTGQPAKRWSAEAINAIFAYHWPGNVRELENMVEYAYHIASGDLIGPECLPERIHAALAVPRAAPESPPRPEHREVAQPAPECEPGPAPSEVTHRPVTPAGEESPQAQQGRPAAGSPRRRRRPLLPEEAAAIEQALARWGRSTTGKEQAARELGISRATLYRRLKQLAQGANQLG